MRYKLLPIEMTPLHKCGSRETSLSQHNHGNNIFFFLFKRTTKSMARFLAIKKYINTERNVFKLWLMAVKVDLNEIAFCRIHTKQRGEGRLSGSRQSLREIFHLSFHSSSHYMRDIQGNTSTAVSSCHIDIYIYIYRNTCIHISHLFEYNSVWTRQVVGAALNEMGIMSSSLLSLCSWRACRKSPTSELAIMELVDKRYMMIHITFSCSSYVYLSQFSDVNNNITVYTHVFLFSN